MPGSEPQMKTQMYFSWVCNSRNPLQRGSGELGASAKNRPEHPPHAPEDPNSTLQPLTQDQIRYLCYSEVERSAVIPYTASIVSLGIETKTSLKFSAVSS